ncbi:Heart- and neural crest derivatives-expressed protein 2 [Camelus dromedarius]|uniref:Heart-and neural crest derivatives-expressed protein 2 n=1 Tax=Camelus dromedarius TaxID=9838 RepID=A0A5N4CAT2_CAMDR|nr:Heart- and neural crest derivatives-expressed protein 2 [Camelus dromedarius]
MRVSVRRRCRRSCRAAASRCSHEENPYFHGWLTAHPEMSPPDYSMALSYSPEYASGAAGLDHSHYGGNEFEKHSEQQRQENQRRTGWPQHVWPWSSSSEKEEEEEVEEMEEEVEEGSASRARSRMQTQDSGKLCARSALRTSCIGSSGFYVQFAPFSCPLRGIRSPPPPPKKSAYLKKAFHI